MFRTAMILFLLSAVSVAKPIHFEDLKFELITQNIRCTDCHTDTEDPALTPYGQHIADEGSDQSIQARVRTFEESLSLTASDDEKKEAADRIDIDSDGITNWIELLANTNPSVADERNKMHDRIERVISCKLCHVSVAAFPQPGRERAPHNAFGDSLKDDDSKRAKRRRRKSINADDDILARLKQSRRTDSDKDRIKDWDEITTFHHPADKDDTPDRDLVKQFKKHLKTHKKSGGGFEPAHHSK